MPRTPTDLLEDEDRTTDPLSSVRIRRGAIERQEAAEAEHFGQLGAEYGVSAEEYRRIGPEELQRRASQARQRAFLEEELANIRAGSGALRERAEETLTLGRRGIREGERRRLGQAETSLAGLGLSQSGLSERVRRAERETTAFAEADLESRVRITEMDEMFKAEQQAIDRLFASGENELGYFRQVRLLQIQAQYAKELAEIQSGNAFFNMLGSALGTLGTIALYSVNPALGAAATIGTAAAGDED
jgi:hypothetical protein